MACDLDSFDLPAFVDPVRDIEHVIDGALDQLPEAFRDASCYWQLTSGHGIKAGGRCRLWFWLSRPTRNRELKVWLSNAKVDPSVFAIVQPIYTAAPLLANGTKDFLAVRSGIRAGTVDEVEVPGPETLAGFSTYGARGASSGFTAESGRRRSRRRWRPSSLSRWPRVPWSHQSGFQRGDQRGWKRCRSGSTARSN